MCSSLDDVRQRGQQTWQAWPMATGFTQKSKMHPDTYVCMYAYVGAIYSGHSIKEIKIL